MTRIDVMIDGQSYRMACEEGDEDRLQSLAGELDTTVRSLREKLGDLGGRRLTVIAALSILDRLREAEAEVAALTERMDRLERARQDAVLRAEAEDEPLIEELHAAAAAVEDLTQKIGASARAVELGEPEASFASDAGRPKEPVPPAPPEENAAESPPDTKAEEPLDIVPAFARRG
ncbi:MAG: cell division protein ZapA [Devosia sp.]